VTDPRPQAEAILGGLRAYGLGDAVLDVVRVQLGQALEALSHGADPSGGTVADSLAALRAVGWSP
jgi:hypothetical protein